MHIYFLCGSLLNALSVFVTQRVNDFSPQKPWKPVGFGSNRKEKRNWVKLNCDKGYQPIMNCGPSDHVWHLDAQLARSGQRSRRLWLNQMSGSRIRSMNGWPINEMNGKKLRKKWKNLRSENSLDSPQAMHPQGEKSRSNKWNRT
jgi:hypothetical protein